MTHYGENIYLRKMTLEDTDDIVRWRNSEFVRSRFIYQADFTREGHLSWIRNMIDTGKVVQFIIIEKSGDRKVGSVYLRDIDYDNKKAEFGIFIGEEDALGKGYGREAARLITQYGFRELGLQKIFLRVLADNPRAIASYERAGFKREGLFHNDVIINGKPQDVIFMAMFAEDYE